MEGKRTKRKRSGDTSAGQQPSQTRSLQSPQPGPAPLAQSAPPAIRLTHAGTPAKTASGGSRKRSAAQSDAQKDDLPKAVPETLRSVGRPIDSAARAELESRTGRDLSHIRVHTDEQSTASARALDARAYTAGSHIVFGQGEYAPNTTEGRRLLAHEAAHALHQTELGAARPGVAPPDSIGERRADEFAASFTSASRERELGRAAPLNFREWGEAWHIHRTPTIVTRGAVAHTGDVGAPAAGQPGAAIGSVEVRSGEDLEEGGVSLPNRIALEYAGARANVSRWLQFVWFEMFATTPTGNVQLSGNVRTTSSTKPFTTNTRTPNWSVDSASTTDPFYEAAARNIRSGGGTIIFDAPGGASASPLATAAFTANPTATNVTFIAHFDSYLIQNNVAAYHVAWTATTTFTRSAGTTTASAIAYAVQLSSGPVTAIPVNLRTILRTSYRTFPGVRSIR